MIWSEEIFKRFVSAELPTQKSQVLYLNDEESCMIQVITSSENLRHEFNFNTKLFFSFLNLSYVKKKV